MQAVEPAQDHAISTCKWSRIISLQTGQLPVLTSSCTMQLQAREVSQHYP